LPMSITCAFVVAVVTPNMIRRRRIDPKKVFRVELK